MPGVFCVSTLKRVYYQGVVKVGTRVLKVTKSLVNKCIRFRYGGSLTLTPYSTTWKRAVRLDSKITMGLLLTVLAGAALFRYPGS